MGHQKVGKPIGMLIIPAIDLKDGRCVRLTQGRKSEVKIYDADPVGVARAGAYAEGSWEMGGNSVAIITCRT